MKKKRAELLEYMILYYYTTIYIYTSWLIQLRPPTRFAQLSSENEPGMGTAIDSNNPVVWRQTRGRTHEKNGKYDLFLWAECERQMTMRNGNVIISGS